MCWGMDLHIDGGAAVRIWRKRHAISTKKQMTKYEAWVMAISHGFRIEISRIRKGL